jgi:hypothetical protein
MWGDDYGYWTADGWLDLPDVTGMTSPVRCTRCDHVYDLGKVTVIGRYADCSVWKCPGCKITVDDRPVGWGDHHYVELNRDGSERR